jgi:hypothetical protein
VPRLYSINIGGGSGSGVDAAGEQAITNGSSTVAVVFSSDIGTTGYGIAFSIFNDTDVNPIMLQGVVTTVSNLGFTVTLNAPADSANYLLKYVVTKYV